jgi:hypothetical protein
MYLLIVPYILKGWVWSMATIFAAHVTVLSAAYVWFMQSQKSCTDAIPCRFPTVGDGISSSLHLHAHRLADWWAPPRDGNMRTYVVWYTSLIANAAALGPPMLLPPPPTILSDACRVPAPSHIASVYGACLVSPHTPCRAVWNILRMLHPPALLGHQVVFEQFIVFMRERAMCDSCLPLECTVWLWIVTKQVAHGRSADDLLDRMMSMFRREILACADVLGRLAWVIDAANGSSTSPRHDEMGYAICTCYSVVVSLANEICQVW